MISAILSAKSSASKEVGGTPPIAHTIDCIVIGASRAKAAMDAHKKSREYSDPDMRSKRFWLPASSFAQT